MAGGKQGGSEEPKNPAWTVKAPPSIKPTDEMLNAMKTAMASDRTLMAWTRTSLSFYTFGFALYKILSEVQKVGKVTIHDNAPRNYGLLLIAMGTVAMVMGTGEYWATLTQLRSFQGIRIARASFIMALWMCLAGIFLFCSVIVKIF